MGEKRGMVGAAVVMTLSLAVAMAGCSADYAENNEASVNLIVAGINGGAVLDSDIRFGTNDPTESDFICEDEVTVSLAVRHKNPNAVAPSVPNAVLLTGYEVQYTRTDGRGTEGVDVPFRITGAVSLGIDVANSGTVDVPIEVVRRQAKLEPPLTNVQQAEILSVNATVTMFGETVSGKRVSGSGAFQIDFADFGDDETSCPGN